MISIQFTEQQLAIIDKAIQQIPYYLAAPLVAHINEEIAKQQNDVDSDKQPNTPIP